MQAPLVEIPLTKGKKIFFLSDFHLGAPSYEESRKREVRILEWIEKHRHEAAALFLLGDIFDYWFEYRHVVPKGFVRLLAKLAELTDSGLPVHFLGGNHDTWMRDYFQKEIGMQVHTGNIELAVGEARFLLGHGDGFGQGEKGYKLMKALFNAKITRILYAALHPYWGCLIASGMSRHSRKSGLRRDERMQRKENRERTKNQRLLEAMQHILEQRHFDGFILAHRHWPVLMEISATHSEVKHIDNAVIIPRNSDGKTYYLNTGDWLRYFSYGSYDGEILKLEGEFIRKTF